MTKRAAIPSLFTVTNLLCGFLAIFYAANGRLVPACWLIVTAAFLDAFDGKVARLIDDGSSEFGMQFDSLVDVCSFGVAPAVIMLHYFDGILGTSWLPFCAAFLFLMCGALRLARFNTGQTAQAPPENGPVEKSDFIGLPIPVAAATLVAYVVFSERVWDSAREPHVALSLMALVAFLMVSPFDYPAFPRFTFETSRDRRRMALAVVCVIPVIFATEEMFFPITLAFCLSGAVRWVVHLITDRETADIG